MKSFKFIALLSLYWILLSGHLEPLLLGLGAASVALTVFLTRRMNSIDKENYPLNLSPKIPSYFLYLFKEIVKANIDVAKRILGFRGASISPQMIEIPQTQKSVAAAATYANSITLTPGTVTVSVSKDTLIIHALSKKAADELATGAMSAEISNRAFSQ